jgi:hypothetical protein
VPTQVALRDTGFGGDAGARPANALVAHLDDRDALRRRVLDAVRTN